MSNDDQEALIKRLRRDNEEYKRKIQRKNAKGEIQKKMHLIQQ